MIKATEYIRDKNRKLTPLEYEEFSDYLVYKNTEDGLIYEFEFNNGYKARVVKKDGSNGYCSDLFELWLYQYGKLCKASDTQSVIGWINNAQVLNLLEQIKNHRRYLFVTDGEPEIMEINLMVVKNI